MEYYVLESARETELKQKKEANALPFLSHCKSFKFFSSASKLFQRNGRFTRNVLQHFRSVVG